MRRLPRVKQIVAESTRFGNIAAFTDGSGVMIRWQMRAEVENFGFYVYRIDGKDAELVGDSLTLGAAAKVAGKPLYGQEYFAFDPEGNAHSWYRIETAPLRGQKQSSDPFSAELVNDLKSVGEDRDLLYRKAKPATGRIESDDLVLNKELYAEVEDAQQSPDINTQRWVAAQPGAKIGVRKDGVYRVTRAQLQAAGFNVNSDSTFWHLYNDGVQQSIIVGNNGDYIEFYGKSLDTVESDTRMYYLVAGPTPGLRMDVRYARVTRSNVVARAYNQTSVKKERTLFLDSIINGDAENFFGSTISNTPYTLTFNLSAVDFTVANFTMEVALQGFSLTIHPISVMLNGEILDPIMGAGNVPYRGVYTLPTSYLREGANSLRLVSNAASDFSLFDNLKVNYSRNYSAVQNALSFYTQNSKSTRVTGFSSPNVRLFDITQDGAIAVLNNVPVVANGPTFTLNIPAARGRVYYAVEDSGLLQPASVSANTPSTLSTANHSANLVIITHRNFLTQAEAWANYRRSQGITVEVVDVADIFDEFNYGVLSANSIKAFLQYARSNWLTAPQYVLLAGDATYDSRDYNGLGFANFVPVKMVTTLFSETGSDDALADFNGDGLAEMAIGRIPANTPQVLTDSLARVMTFEQPANQTLSRGTLFAYDVDPNFDFGAMSTRIRDQLPVGTQSTMVSRLPASESENALVSAINTGKYAVNYSGHGSVGAWHSTSFFSGFNLDSCTAPHPCVTNATNRSIFTALTCLNGYFYNAFGDGLGERILKYQNGGGIVVWASTGLTTADVQEVMATRFYQQLGLGAMTRMGDLVLDAKSVLPGGSDVRFSWVLLGDPMLKVRP